MNKLSASKLAEVLQEVGPVIRAQAEEIQELRTKLAAYERRDRLTKVAAKMQEKGLDADPIEDIIEKLSNLDDRTLTTREDAVDMFGPDMGARLGLSDAASNASANAIEAYVLS